MKVVARISVDVIKLTTLREKLKAIASTIDGSAPQESKDRRIKSILSMAEKLVEEMIVVEYEEVSNG
jgi:ppGpp synthetase/RelA/SpoT-type nucleotidyltranferase